MTGKLPEGLALALVLNFTRAVFDTGRLAPVLLAAAALACHAPGGPTLASSEASDASAPPIDARAQTPNDASLASQSPAEKLAPDAAPSGTPSAPSALPPTAISGTYSGLVLGIDESTHRVTGYFDDATGFDEATRQPRFRCTFYLTGVLVGESARIVTWFPTDGPSGGVSLAGGGSQSDDVIAGELTLDGGGGDASIHLASEHGGCWNVRHFADPEPARFSREDAGDWFAIRVVSRARSHFFVNAADRSPERAYAVRGDVVFVTARGGGKVRGHVNDTTGWLPEADLFPDEPPGGTPSHAPVAECPAGLVWDSKASDCRMVPDAPYEWAGCSRAPTPPVGFACVTGASWGACTCSCDGNLRFDPEARLLPLKGAARWPISDEHAPRHLDALPVHPAVVVRQQRGDHRAHVVRHSRAAERRQLSDHAIEVGVVARTTAVEVGLDRARRDRVGRDPAGAELLRQRAREDLEPPFIMA